MLKTIRKPYLSTSEPPPLSRRARAATAEEDDDKLKRYEGSKYLSERERDEIDVRAKMILRRCRERVGLLEEQEKCTYLALKPRLLRLLTDLIITVRKKKVAQATPAIFNFFPSLVPTTVDNSEMFLSAHRSSIIWTLTNLLAQLTAAQSDMQEERAKRRAERSRTLGGGAAREAAQMTVVDKGSGRGPAVSVPSTAFSIVAPDEPPIEQQLSAAQLQQFESENNALLDHMQSQLDSVLAAEKSLLEISNLQTELVKHLAQQTEITDRLYDEAIGSVAEMGKANQQLKKAKERSGEARLFLIIFLLGASFALLFLNWYA